MYALNGLLLTHIEHLSSLYKYTMCKWLYTIKWEIFIVKILSNAVKAIKLNTNCFTMLSESTKII